MSRAPWLLVFAFACQGDVTDGADGAPGADGDAGPGAADAMPYTDAAAGSELRVVSVSPPAHRFAPATASIAIEFDRPVRRSSVTPASLWAFARWSGAVDGAISYSDDDRVVTLTPAAPLSAGESVMVVLSNELRSRGGAPLRAAGYSYQFNVSSAAAGLDYTSAGSVSSRGDPGEYAQAYGGIASDLDGDGWLDIAIVNEASEDLAVMLNSGDGTASFGDILEPLPRLGVRASPSEPTDFDRDGHTDVAIANIGGRSVSILLGNGDGSFGPTDDVGVGRIPRGLAVLDADGDGDIDIANTNFQDGNVSVLLNDGTGAFGEPSYYEPGGSGEWALAATDMNNDGILDLVVGARDSEQIIVMAGNGDGSFERVSARHAGGAPWMLVTGDLDGDGNADVSVANGITDNGAILLGDGQGGLGEADVQVVDPTPLATDLGDLDGDGDLDWVLSSFGGDWSVFLNDGNGGMELERELPSGRAASCALIFDADNDGDVDLALIDEIEDTVTVLRNE